MRIWTKLTRREVVYTNKIVKNYNKIISYIQICIFLSITFSYTNTK